MVLLIWLLGFKVLLSDFESLLLCLKKLDILKNYLIVDAMFDTTLDLTLVTCSHN